MNVNDEIRKIRLAKAKSRIEKVKKGVFVSSSYVALAGASPSFRFPTNCRLQGAQVVVGTKADLLIELESSGQAIGYRVVGAEGIVDRSFKKMVTKGDVIRFSSDGQELSVTLILNHKVNEENEEG